MFTSSERAQIVESINALLAICAAAFARKNTGKPVDRHFVGCFANALDHALEVLEKISEPTK
jgi:hypothetical protein